MPATTHCSLWTSPTKSESDALETWFGQSLPAAFVAALGQYGGRPVEPDLPLYAADELLECNRAFETSLYRPDYLAIGDDGDGRAVVVALDDHWQVPFLVNHGVMTSDCFESLVPSLEAWLEAGPCPPK